MSLLACQWLHSTLHCRAQYHLVPMTDNKCHACQPYYSTTSVLYTTDYDKIKVCVSEHPAKRPAAKRPGHGLITAIEPQPAAECCYCECPETAVCNTSLLSLPPNNSVWDPNCTNNSMSTTCTATCDLGYRGSGLIASKVVCNSRSGAWLPLTVARGCSPSKQGLCAVDDFVD